MTTFKETRNTHRKDSRWQRSWRSSPSGQIPLKFTAYDGSTAGPEDAELGLDLLTPRGTTYLATAPGELGLARAYVSGDLDPLGVHPADPYELLMALADNLDFKLPPPRVLANIVRAIGIEHLKPIAPPPQEAIPRWRRVVEGLRHSKTRDAEAIHHHYDVSNTFYEWVLGPSMTYTCAATRTRTQPWKRRRRTSTGWCSRSCGSSRATACSTSAAAGAAWSATPHGTG